MSEMQDKPEQLDFFSLLSNNPLCLYCNKSFKKTTHNKKYCSLSCSGKDKYYKKEKEKKEYLLNTNFICPTCNGYYKKTKLRDDRKYCSAKCREKYYYITNRKKIIQRTKDKIKSNVEKYKAYQKEWRNKNRNKKRTYYNRERNREYYRKNRKKIKERYQEYYRKNRKKIRQRAYKRHKKRMLEDANYKIKYVLRNRIKEVLLSQKTIKSETTLELLGCSWEHARKHIESQFKEGMTWDSHGLYGWHIDHIVPCASFDLTDSEQQKKCFNYKNLQPLWWHENLSKGAKIIE
jgi:hypothetical protein